MAFEPKSKFSPPPAVLIADGYDSDVELLRVAFARAGVRSSIVSVRSGPHVLAYLKGQEPYADRSRFPFPHLLLLETSLPLVSGLEVLADIRRTPEYSFLPVIMLTDATSRRERERARALHANSLLLKPLRLEALNATIQSLAAFWLGACRLPEFDPGLRAAANP